MERVRLHRRATTGAPTTTEQAANMPAAWVQRRPQAARTTVGGAFRW